MTSTWTPTANGSRLVPVAVGPSFFSRCAGGEARRFCLQYELRRPRRAGRDRSCRRPRGVGAGPARVQGVRSATGSGGSRGHVHPAARGKARRDYDLFFLFQQRYEVFALAAVPTGEALPRRRLLHQRSLVVGHAAYLLGSSGVRPLFVGMRHPVDTSRDRPGAPALSPAGGRRPPVFAASQDGAAAIDITNIGRRSAVTHRALVTPRRDRRIVYYTTRSPRAAQAGAGTFRVDEASEHRLLLASILQRSRI